jgi:Immunity protein 35
MHRLDVGSAEVIARERVNKLAEAAGDQFEILSELTRAVDVGWVFFFNTSDFVRTRETSCAVAGNGPILIAHDGTTYELPSAIPWEQAVLQLKLKSHQRS